jgi:hypothetical protein
MHSTTVAVVVMVAIQAVPGFSPVPKTHGFKFIFPNMNKLFGINVALNKIAN